MNIITRLTAMGIGLTAVMAFGQTINITGTVVDSITTQPIANAAVKLIDMPAITATTNTLGKFALTGTATAANGQIQRLLRTGASVSGNAFVLSGLIAGDAITVDVFNVAGMRTFHAEDKAHNDGRASFVDLWRVPGLYYVKVRAGRDKAFFKCMAAAAKTVTVYSSQVTGTGRLAKIFAVHTLEVSKSGYLARQVTMTGETGDAGTIRLKLSMAPYDWVGVIGTGQSLSVGAVSVAPVNTTQPYHNLKLLDSGPDPKYPVDGSTTAVWSAIPLTEPIRPWLAGYGTCNYPPDNCWYPNNIWKTGETPHSGMANTLSKIWLARTGGDYVTAHSVVGIGGALLIYLAKGMTSYLAGLSETRVYTTLAGAAGKTYGVGGIILTHGESDGTSQVYEAGIYQLWSDYNTDLKAITGQTRDIVMFGSQQSTTGGRNNTAVQLWHDGVMHPGQMVCTGPKYQYVYSDGLHLNAGGYERLGEKYGEVFDLVINQRVSWKPVGPNGISRSGATITLTIDVPNPPLVWDSHISPPTHTGWVNGRGFEVSDSTTGGDVAISSVQIQGSNIILTLAQTPAPGTLLLVSYATSPDNLRGQLRDSDPFAGADSEVIATQVTSGSPQIKPVASGAFYRRIGHDIVSGTGVPADMIVTGPTTDGTGLILSSSWTGATGTVPLSFHHEEYNYCVHFTMPVQ